MSTASGETTQAAPPSPEAIMELGSAFWGSKALLSAIELGVFSELAASGPLDAEALRDRLALHDRSARDFFDAPVALGMLVRENGSYRNTPETELFLDRAKPSYAGGMLEMMNARLFGFWSSLTEALRTGMPQNEAKTGGDFFEVLYSDPERLRGFAKAMTGISMGSAQALAATFPWDRYQTVIDIGCAEGCVPAQLARDHAHLSGGGFDLPPMAPLFEEYVAAAGLADRVRFYPVNFFADERPTADVLVMGHILHDWDLDEKRMLLEKAYRALPDGGALIVYEAIIDDGRRHNAMGLLMSLNMLIETPGGTFLNTTQLAPSGGALTEGPANVYPSRILVSGLSGTVTKATVTLIGYRSSSPDDVDMVITGPNGRKVMLMSDVCGVNPSTVQDENWTFDDSAPTFLSNNGPCPDGQSTSFKPSNYLGAAPEPDDLSQGGGPAPPYLNALSFFNGASPNGAWDLFVLDDNPAFNGFGIPGWALALTVQSPAPPAPESAFTIGELDGKTLSLNVTSAGTMEVADAGAAGAGGALAAAKKRLKTSTASGGPGTIEVKLKLTSAAKKKVRKTGKVKVNARITFTPDGGTPNSQTERLKIKKK